MFNYRSVKEPMPDDAGHRVGVHGMTVQANLEGLRVLVVEDEMMVSMLIEDMLSDLGCTVVGPASRLDEAIELAKTFGGDASGKFVNGVLGAVYKEIGEPGKEYPTREELAKKAEVKFKAVNAVLPTGNDDRAALTFELEGGKIQLVRFFILLDKIPYSGMVEKMQWTRQGKVGDIVKVSADYQIFNYAK